MDYLLSPSLEYLLVSDVTWYIIFWKLWLSSSCSNRSCWKPMQYHVESWTRCELFIFYLLNIKLLYISKWNILIVETERWSCWRICYHWLHWKLSFWQLPVQPVITNASTWRLFRFSIHAHMWWPTQGWEWVAMKKNWKYLAGGYPQGKLWNK